MSVANPSLVVVREEPTSSNWFQKVFHIQNQQQRKERELARQRKHLDEFYVELRDSRGYPENLRIAVRKAVELMEERYAFEAANHIHGPRTQQDPTRKQSTIWEVDSQEERRTIFQKFVDLFWPLDEPYQETPFYRSAFSSSSEVAKLCFALYILNSTSSSTGSEVDSNPHFYPGFETSKQTVQNLALQVGLADWFKVVCSDLDANQPHPDYVWPFHAFLHSQHSLLDMAEYAMYYLAPFPTLSEHAKSVVQEWEENRLAVTIIPKLREEHVSTRRSRSNGEGRSRSDVFPVPSEEETYNDAILVEEESQPSFSTESDQDMDDDDDFL